MLGCCFAAAGFTARVMLLYDGLHYDALAVSPCPGAPEDLDITIFDTAHAASPDAPWAAAALLVAAAHKARQFTNTSTFTLRCGVCQKGLTGQKEAAEHAAATGHTNFQEY